MHFPKIFNRLCCKSSLWEIGTPPDYRFTLANERTFLAWIRTALAFLAASVGLDQLANDLAFLKFKVLLVIALSISSAVLSSYAYIRWKENEKAMRLNQLLPYPRSLLWLSTGLTLGVIVITVILLTR